MVSSESSQEEVLSDMRPRGAFKLSKRPALAVVAKGKRPRRFTRHEAAKSLAKILELACKPLTQTSIHGRPVTTSALMAKDANHQGMTFTAKMQPKVIEGQSVELFFRCR